MLYNPSTIFEKWFVSSLYLPLKTLASVLMTMNNGNFHHITQLFGQSNSRGTLHPMIAQTELIDQVRPNTTISIWS